MVPCVWGQCQVIGSDFLSAALEENRNNSSVPTKWSKCLNSPGFRRGMAIILSIYRKIQYLIIWLKASPLMLTVSFSLSVLPLSYLPWWWSPRSTADHVIYIPSLFLSPCCLLFLPKTMEEATKVTDTVPALPPLLERRVRQRQPTVSVLKSKLKQSATCSVPRVRSTLTGFFPVVRWLPKYKLREYIWGDLMSGVIVGIILVPQAIAYCLLAGVEPIYGLYTSFYANIIYFLMGTSRHVSVGIFSLMSLMVGQVMDHK